MLADFLASLRLTVASVLLCCVAYTGLVLGASTLIEPEGRAGDLATVDGVVVGSWRVAQEFTRAEYLWPRPSAVNYAADATGGSNLSPANPLITERAHATLARLGASDDRPAPADLVTASGSGIDPHISLAGALYQAPRIAAARAAAIADVETIIQGESESAPGSARIVNVLRVNIALDRQLPAGKPADKR